MGVEGAVLEDHRDIPVTGRQVIGDPPVEVEIPGSDFLETRDHPQQRGLSAAGWAEQDEQFALFRAQAHAIDREMPPGVHLCHAVENDGTHRHSFLPGIKTRIPAVIVIDEVVHRVVGHCVHT